MAKTTRTPQEVQEFKNIILQVAVDLISTMGFNNMSMRKLAGKLGMTAANIYNYYSSKDELYLDIQTNGFNVMYERCINSVKDISDPRKKLANIIREYIRFGIEDPHCYDIIFSMDTPKYRDYRNSKIEPVAFLEKQAGMKLFDATVNITKEFYRPNNINLEDLRFNIIHLWIQVHGLVSLYNSRVLQEVEENTEALISNLVEVFLMNCITTYPKDYSTTRVVKSF
ncbi:MAG TPA: TetR/AcrR family transcriptional regulator [Syntrophomonadaceae bacterium]|nr:TetR/AcrR family transcriptional regulator [Syntrophomonadaceae bacterium]